MRTIFALMILTLVALSASAQLTVQNGLTATQLGNNLSGSNISVTNASITGTPLQYGTFQFTGSGFPLSSGVVLSTGSIFDCHGPNSSGSMGNSMGGPGHPLLTAIAGVTTYDAVQFQFSFEVQSDQVEFQYIFASEEYNEFVGSSYNDVFAFFISGPGITGQQNIALVPNTTVPVAINNINLGSYWQYYNNNETGTTNIEFDGYTNVLTAKKTGLIPCETYTLTLCIADAGDGILDAAVFLQESSLIQGTVSAQANTFSNNNTALEGCIDANFTFMLDSAVSVNTVIPIGIGGTAVNGVDYEFIDSILTIPAGQLSATLIIDALSDGISEGQETVELYFSPAPCQPFDTVQLYIDDYQTLEFETLPSDLSCFQSNDGSVAFTITGGSPPFTVQLTDSATGITATYTSLPVTGLPIGTYYVKVLDGYGCWAEDIINGAVFDAGATFLPDGNGVAYETSVVLSGFGAGQTLTDIHQLQSVCMNMEHSFIGDLKISLRSPNGTEVILKQQPGGSKTNMGEPVATGPNDTQSQNITPGIGYDYCFNANPTYGTMVAESNTYTYTYISTTGLTLTDKYLPAGSYTPYEPLSGFIGTPLNGTWTLKVIDDIPNNNGYIFNWSISIAADPPDSVVTLSQPSGLTLTSSYVNPGCNLNNGSINLTVTGTTAPYTYAWSNGATTEDINGIGAGNYTVTVTGSDNCQTVKTFSLTNNGAVGISGVVTNQLCPTGNTGAVNISLIGGTAPYNYLWSNGATTEDVTGLAPGNYSVQITDAGNCIGAASFTVQPASPMSVAGNTVNEQCGDHEGTIDITVFGGVTPYTYVWSNSQTTQDIQDLQQGTYIVTITDFNGCTKTASFSIVNLVGNCIPVCDLQITASNVGHETCGNGQGMINQTVYSTNLPINISWNTGQTTGSIYNLHAGIYTVTLSDAAGCTLAQSYTVQNNTGNLTISGSSVTNELCGNSNGGVDISITGGVQPYSYHWSNNATTQDISGVHGGTYALTITDGNGCQLFQSYTITNQTGTLAISYGNAMNATCGHNNGSIDITVTGGTLPYTYHWSNNAVTQDLINIYPGTYTCTITDGQGCDLISPAYIVGNNTGTLAISYLDSDPEVCGNSQGKLQITIQGGTGPYAYSWSNGATVAVVSGLHAGTYSCTVTDASGCTITSGTVVIENLPGTLALNGIVTQNETCSNMTGSVVVNVSGGTAPLTYAWNTGSVAQNLYNVHAGSYSCIVTDASGCSFSVSATVNNTSGSLSIQNLVALPEICGNGTGSIDVYTGGETAPVTYLWSNGSTLQNIGSLHAGIYTVTVTDASGCSAVSVAEVANQTGNLHYEISSLGNEICNNANGYINLNVTGGNAPLSFLWSDNSTTEDLTGISAGIYQCTITDNNSCVLVTSPFSINNTVTGINVQSAVANEVCNNNQGSVVLNVSGGTGPYTYLWTGGMTTTQITGLNEGSYSVTITNASGCSLTQVYTVTNSAGTLSAGAISISDEVCNNSSGSIVPHPSGGTAPYSYLWSTGSTAASLTGLVSGMYALTLSDASGCVLILSDLAVAQNPGTFHVNSISVTDESCGSGNGAISVTLGGAFPPVSYNWSNSSNTLNISNISSGVYTCTATDNNGCELTYSATVLSDPGNFLVEAALISPSTCNQPDGAIDVDITGGTSPYSLIWSNGATSEDISGLSAGNYTLLASDAAGCSSSQTYTVGNNGGTPVISSVTIGNEQCSNHGGSVTVSVTGGQGPYDYDWSGGSSQPCCNYTLSIQDLFGDGWDGAYVLLYLDGSLYGSYSTTASSSQFFIPVCDVQTISLQYVAGSFENEHVYTLSGPSGILYNAGPNPPVGNVYNAPVTCQSVVVSNSANLSGLGAGTYAVTITDQNGCSTSGSYTVLNDPGNMAMTVASVTPDYCGTNVGAVNITVTGGSLPVSYVWSNGATTQDVSAVHFGNYTVTIQDQNSCQIIETITVPGSPTINDDDKIITPAYCNQPNGSIVLNLTGGAPPFLYQWSNGMTTADITSVLPGNYSVTVTDAHNCTNTYTYTIPNNTNGMISFISGTSPVCANLAGSVDLTVTGGNMPYTFLWNNGATTEDLMGIGAGTYTVTLTDNTLCSDVQQIVITELPGNLFIGSTFVQNEFCGGNDGYIQITTSGGTPPLTYAWNTGATTEDLTGLAASTYIITITDQNGCTFSQPFILQNDGWFEVADTVITHATCFDCPDGSIQLTLSFSGGSSGTMEYQWSNGATTQNISGLLPGTYTVTITNTDFSCEVVEIYVVDYGTAVTDISYHFRLFPNPTNGIFTAEASAALPDGCLITVYDPLGRPVRSLTLPAGYSGKVITDLSGLADGMYLVRLETGKARSVHYIVKQSLTY